MAAYFDTYQSPPLPDGRSSIHPRLVHPSQNTSKDMMDSNEHATTLTRADISAALSAVSEYIKTQLSYGGRVHLDGIGTFSVAPHFKTPKYAGDKVSGDDVTFKRIVFTPERQLRQHLLQNLTFHHRNGFHGRTVEEEYVKDFLQEYFQTHTGITVRELSKLVHVCATRAGALLRALYEEGFLVRQRIGSAYLYAPAEDGE